MSTLRTGLIFMFVAAGFLSGCKGLDGVDGVDGTDGTDGVDGVDGVDGNDGNDGNDGVDGEDGEDYYGTPDSLVFTITGVEISGPPVVTFTLVDQDGNAFNRLNQSHIDSRSLRWSIAKLVPGENGDNDHWQAYINSEENSANSGAGPNGVPVLATAIQGTSETSGTLEYLGDGEYAYTFGTDITAVTSPLEVPYEDDLLHRVAIQFGVTVGDTTFRLNPYFDFVPSGGTAPVTHDVVSTESCNECHDPLAIHGGGRFEIELCVTCHNPGSTDANSGNSVNLGPMVHSIHMGHSLPEPGYTIWGFRNSEHDYSHVGYPQSQANCIKCHDGDDPETPDGNNWATRPTADTCGGCHNDVDFATGENHVGGQQQTNASCAICHTEENINLKHTTENATDNNPNLPDGYANITYELVSATVNTANTLTIRYKVYRDGVAFDISNPPSDLAGSSRTPSLLLAYALPQDGLPAPEDFNNLGRAAGQPASIGLTNLAAGTVTGASISYSGDTNTVTLQNGYGFPTGATMRTVALQGYYNQSVNGSDVARHAISVLTTVTGDTPRREVADSEGCASCHEWFEGHGGNRVYEVQVCTLCHNPNLSSSGTQLDLNNPESSMALANLVHGIHGASAREEPIEFVRNFRGGTYYAFITEDMLEDYPNGHVMTFPGDLSNCETCHLPGTYQPDSVPVDNQPSTFVTTDGINATTSAVTAARASVPNATDLVSSTTASACGSCHDSRVAAAHMEQNGGAVMWERSEWTNEEPFEACVVCHGEGRTGDVDTVHGN